MTAEPVLHPADPGTVDAENPWPGLAAFREADRELFYGREDETEDLLRLVLRERLTVLFGLSGLGKSSLLQAGLFPRVRSGNVLPVYIRLDFSRDQETRGSLIDQVRQAILREAAAANVEAPPFSAAETLWESFHRQGADFWSPRNDLVTPLLVFDQFEEIFTIGRLDEAFLTELADLCEGSAPESLRARLAQDPADAREYSFNQHSFKILLSLREDFLPELEGLRGRIRSIVHNRLRLQRMYGGNALRVVTLAGGHLVEPGVPEQIVRFVAGRTGGDETPLAELAVEPALLSVICRELNHERRRRGLPRITAALLEGNREEILSDFYERSLADLAPDVRTFVEERLLTRSGFRDSVALESALEEPGVDREALSRLVDRRLLRIEDRGGVQRVELTHDVLAGVIRESRDSRRERETRERAEAARREAEERERVSRRKLRQSRIVTALMAVLLLGVVVLAWRVYASEKRSSRALARADLERAMNALQSNNPAQALAFLAHSVRTDPADPAARAWIGNLLLGRSWLFPRREIQADAGLKSLTLSADGHLVAALPLQGPINIWDLRTGQRVGLPLSHAGAKEAFFNADGRRLVTTGDDSVRLWETATGRVVDSPLNHASLKQKVFFSTDRRRLVTKSADSVVLWDATTGRQLGIVRSDEHEYVKAVSRDAELAVIGSKLIDLRTGEVEIADFIPWVSNSEGGAIFFTLDGHLLAFAVDAFVEKRITVLDLATRQPVGSLPGFDTILGSSLDGARLLVGNHIELDEKAVWNVAQNVVAQLDPHQTSLMRANDAHTELRVDGGLVLWGLSDYIAVFDAENGKVLKIIQPGGTIESFEPSGDGRVLIRLNDGTARLWSLESGEPLSQAVEPVSEAHLSADGRSMVTASPDGTIRLWDTTLGHALPEVWLTPGFPLAISPDGSRLAILEPDERTARMWDVARRRPISPPIHLVSPQYRSSKSLFSPEGDLLAVPEKKGYSVWKVETGARIAGPVEHRQALAFGPGGRSILEESENTVWLRRLDASPGHLSPPMNHGGTLHEADLSPDGRLVLTVGEDGLVRIWNAETATPDGQPLRHEGVYRARFSPDGRRVVSLASLKDDHTGLVWDLGTRRSVSPKLRNPQWSNPPAFDPASGRVALGTDEVRLWSFPAGDLLGEPLQATPPLGAETLRFSSDGQRLLKLATPSGTHYWLLTLDTPVVPAQGAGDLLRLAEAVAGLKVDDQGRLAPVRHPASELDDLRRSTAAATAGTPAASLVRWFLTDPARRTVGPAARMTVPEMIRMAEEYQHLWDSLNYREPFVGSLRFLRYLRRDPSSTAP